MSCKITVQSKVKSCLKIVCGGGLVFAGINLYKGNEQFYREVFMPSIQMLTDGETAHKAAVLMAKYGLTPKMKDDSELLPILRTTVWGLNFKNPIGLAAGFDKDGQAIHGLSKIGFGFIEIGSVTPEPQFGNEKPRVFRLVADRGVINRYGFNSLGHKVVKSNIESKQQIDKKVIIGLNLGKNKSTEDGAQDFVKGVLEFGDSSSVDYLVVNISSPNTPNLRQLQNKSELKNLIEEVLKVRNEVNPKKPLLIKMAPDLNDTQLKEMADIINNFVTTKSFRGIDGLILTNTTIERQNELKSEQTIVGQTGGLSGLPLKQKSTNLIRKMYKLTNGKLPIIGVGGVFTGEDAYEKIRAGASLIQIYTAITYEGPPVVDKIKRELALILRSNGFESVVEAIGRDHKSLD